MLGVDEVFVGCWVLMKCLFGVVDLLDDSS
jgi:hypothetical protein